MSRALRKPSPSMVVALIALVISLGGTAMAAGLVNGDSLIKKRSLSGNRLRNHTLTGTQIDLNRLGKVPNAAHADAATTAVAAQTARSVSAPTWVPLALQGGATQYSTKYGTPSYTKDALGFVHLSGAVDLTGVSGVFATLPPGFRPTRAPFVWLRAASTNGGADPHLVDIEIQSSTGQMTAFLGTGATGAFVGLEGISFYAG